MCDSTSIGSCSDDPKPMSRLPVPSNVPAAKSVALSEPRIWLGLEAETPANIVAITPSS